MTRQFFSPLARKVRAFSARYLSRWRQHSPPRCSPSSPRRELPPRPPTLPQRRRPATRRRAAPADDSASDTGSTVLRVGVNEVSLIFTVTDRHGHYIPNLNQNDFALLDDQKAPERVNSFHQQINLPLRVGIVIDASTSIRSRFQFEQQSAIEFLLQVLKARSDRAFVMGFDVTPTVTADWTNDHGRAGDRRQQAEPGRRHGAL